VQNVFGSFLEIIVILLFTCGVFNLIICIVMKIKKQLKMALVGCFIHLGSSLGFSAVHHVAKEGSDDNPGTLAMPWLTVQHAADQVTAGDRVVIQAGTYSERVSMSRGGTPDQPIVFESDQYEEGSVNDDVSVGGFLVMDEWIEIRGLTLHGEGVPAYQGLLTVGNDSANNLVASDLKFSPTQGGRDGNGSKLYCFYIHADITGVNGVILRRSTFEGFKYVVICISGVGHVVEDCLIQGPGLADAEGEYSETDAMRMFGRDHIVRHNVVRDFTGGGHPDLFQTFSINGRSSFDMLIEQNTFINCEAQLGMFEDQEGLGGIRNWVFRNNVFMDISMQANVYGTGFEFYNNTFYRCTQNTGHPLLFRSAVGTRGRADDCKVYNNIFFKCGRDPGNAIQGWYSVDAEVTGFVTDHNIVIGEGAGLGKTGFSEVNGINGQDPKFVDGAAGDLRLAAESPCIGTARVFTELFTTDRAGTRREELWDIGAFELNGLPRPGRPTGLRIEEP